MTSEVPQNVQDMSINSWEALPQKTREKIILKLQEEGNELKLRIDDKQKTLAEKRATIPEECRKMFEEEQDLRLKHALTAKLHPEIAKKSVGEEETQRLVKLIQERVDGYLEDKRTVEDIQEEAEMKKKNIEELREKLLTMAQRMMNNS